MITWKNIHVHDQCFCKTAPLWESRVTIREGPQRNGKRANLALYFYKATGLHRYSILITIPGLKITIDTVANATKMSFSKAKNSGLVAIIATPLSTLTIKNGYFRTPYVLLENHIERLLLLKHWTEKSQSIPLLSCIDFLTLENYQIADHVWNRPIMHCKPLIIDYVMYSFVLFSRPLS